MSETLSVEAQRAEIRRLAEQRRVLREVERLQRNGLPVPPALLELALGSKQERSE